MYCELLLWVQGTKNRQSRQGQWRLQKQVCGNEHKGEEEGSEKEVTFFFFNLLKLRVLEAAALKKSHFTEPNNHVRMALEPSAHVGIPTAAAPGAVFMH